MPEIEVGVALAMVDEADFASVSAHKWHPLRDDGGRIRYARSSVRQPDGTFKCVLMHRYILGVPAGVLVDHRDGDGLNNVRSNLRAATPLQNASNSKARGTSGLNGVRRLGPHKYLSLVAPGGREIYLGYYKTAEEAAAVYNAAALCAYGEFARLNPGPAAHDVLDAVIAGKEINATRLLDEVEALRKRGTNGIAE